MKFDVIIIGGGHNGLVCGAYLAKRGLSVGIIEHKHVVGGCVVTEQVSKGWNINTYSFEHYVIQNTPIVSDLSLSKFGLRYYPIEPTIFSPFRDGKKMFFHRNLAKTLDRISEFSKHDSKSYERFHAKWSRVSKAIGRAALQKPAPLEHILKSQYSPSEQKDLIDEMKLPAAKILAETFETEYVSSPIAFLGPAAVGQDPSASGTGWLLCWHIGAENLGRPLGGSGQLTRALETAAKSYGAVIMCNETVSEIQVSKGRASKVRTASGKAFEAKTIVSNADPKQTLLKLVSPDALPKSERKKIKAIKVSEGLTFKADYLLKELPRYSCMGKAKSPNESQKAATFIADSVSSISRAFKEYSKGKSPREPALMVALHSSIDHSLVPRGRHGLVLETRYTPYELSGEEWTVESTEEEATRLLSLFSDYCPGVERLVEKFVAMSPPMMESDVMIPRGNFMHADMTLDQMFDLRPAKGLLDGYQVVSIPGLYLCGAGTHPGGAVSGIPGRNAAMQILERMQKF